MSISTEELLKISFFEPLAHDTLVKLSQIATNSTYPKNGQILVENDDTSTILFLHKGIAEVTLSNREGKETLVHTLLAGDIFGEIAILTGNTRSADVVASTACSVISFPAVEFLEQLKCSPDLCMALLKELATRLASSSRRIGDLALFDVNCRVARILDTISTVTYSKDKTIRIIKKAPTHQALANMVGTSREMVTRALNNLEEDGYILREGKSITVIKVPQ